MPTAAATAATDKVIRSMTDDGAFRVITLRTTELVRAALEVRQVSDAEARVFGELLTGAVLIRETMAPTERVQIVLSDREQVSMVADARPDEGLTRGLVSRPAETTEFALGPGTTIKVIRTLPRGQLHQSVVGADAAGVSGALMTYLETSSQVLATLGVATVIHEGHVVASGGYIVQLLPECGHGPLAVMTERLVDFALLDGFLMRHDADARVLMDELLYGFPYTDLAQSPLRWGCFCSEEQALAAIATMGRDELAAVVAKGDPLDLTCEYCGKTWHIAPGQLGELLADA